MIKVNQYELFMNYHYEIKKILKYTLDTIVGTTRNSYE